MVYSISISGYSNPFLESYEMKNEPMRWSGFFKIIVGVYRFFSKSIEWPTELWMGVRKGGPNNPSLPSVLDCFASEDFVEIPSLGGDCKLGLPLPSPTQNFGSKICFA